MRNQNPRLLFLSPGRDAGLKKREFAEEERKKGKEKKKKPWSFVRKMPARFLFFLSSGKQKMLQSRPSSSSSNPKPKGLPGTACPAHLPRLSEELRKESALGYSCKLHQKDLPEMKPFPPPSHPFYTHPKPAAYWLVFIFHSFHWRFASREGKTSRLA